MDHFRYVNHIRKLDGTLRRWDEYNTLARSEDGINLGTQYRVGVIPEADRIKAEEYERRSSLQKTLQSKR